MASWLKSLMGGGEEAELPEELAKLLAQAKRDRRALRDLLKRSEAASTKIEDLAGPLEAMGATAQSLASKMEELQERATALGDSVARLDLIEQREGELARAQERLMETVESTGSATDRLDDRMRQIQSQMEAVAGAEKSVAELLNPEGDVARVRSEVAELMVDVSRLEVRSNAFAQMEPRIEAIAERAEDLTEDQKAMARAIESISKRLAEADTKVAKVGEGFESIALLRKEIEDLSGPSGPITEIRSQIEAARDESSSYGKEVARIGQDQADVRAAHEGVVARYEELHSKMGSLDTGVDKANADVARVEKAMLDLTKADELGARTERQLNALKTLSDHISGKLASVERQREAMDRTEAQARALTDLHWELEAKLKEARAQIKEVSKVHSSVEELRAMNARVAERSAELKEEQARVRRDSKTLRAALAGLQEQMRQSTKRFELEQSTLEADTQRVVALRSDVTDLENRFRELEEARQSVSETGRKIDEMLARTTSLSGDLGRLSEQVESVEGMREGMAEARRTAADVASSLSSVEARQSDVQDAVNDLRTLRGAQEEIASALESLRATRSELERMQSGQAETGAWLVDTHSKIQDLRASVEHLDDLRADVDHMRGVADRVITTAADLEERRESLEELEARMSELQQTGTLLDERTSNLLSALADADKRFKAVARGAGKADAVAEVVEGITAAVAQAERRMAELSEGVDATVERSKTITALSERADKVIDEIRRGERGLSKAAKQLETVSTLRKEVAEAVQSLEDQIRVANEGLVMAEQQSEKIGQRADVLEARAGSLRFAEKRITQFEEKLASLDAAEKALGQSIEALLARQESVGQVRSDVEKLFVASEKTLEDVRAISDARDEVQSAAQMLDSVQAKADAMTQALDTIEARQAQIEQAEVRLSRADALLREIRAGLESLASQRAVVDHVIETTGKLGFEAKEAEGLIDVLREERELTQRIHDAVKKLRDEDSDTLQVKFGTTES